MDYCCKIRQFLYILLIYAYRSPTYIFTAFSFERIWSENCKKMKEEVPFNTSPFQIHKTRYEYCAKVVIISDSAIMRNTFFSSHYSRKYSRTSFGWSRSAIHASAIR